MPDIPIHIRADTHTHARTTTLFGIMMHASRVSTHRDAGVHGDSGSCTSQMSFASPRISRYRRLDPSSWLRLAKTCKHRALGCKLANGRARLNRLTFADSHLVSDLSRRRTLQFLSMWHGFGHPSAA